MHKKVHMTHFVEIFILLQWFGTKPAISPRYLMYLRRTSTQVLKNLSQLDNKKKKCNSIKRWAKDFNSSFTTESREVANKHQKRCSISLIIQELKKKTQYDTTTQL